MAKKKRGFVKNLFKRKVGGTMIGNLIRKAANQATGGLLGNGVMKLQEGETPDDVNKRTVDRLANATSGAALFEKGANAADNFTAKVKGFGVKGILIAVAVIGSIIALFMNMGKKR